MGNRLKLLREIGISVIFVIFQSGNGKIQLNKQES